MWRPQLLLNFLLTVGVGSVHPGHFCRALAPQHSCAGLCTSQPCITTALASRQQKNEFQSGAETLVVTAMNNVQSPWETGQLEAYKCRGADTLCWESSGGEAAGGTGNWLCLHFPACHLEVILLFNGMPSAIFICKALQRHSSP